MLTEGRYPSVEAVRHALGDTGSKSTIHRYLKELADEASGAGGGAREDTARQLQALVAQLADRLHADAERRLSLLRAEFDLTMRAKDAELDELRQTVAVLTARVRELEGGDLVRNQAGAGRTELGVGFGQFGALVSNSRSGAHDISPFSAVRTAGRSDVIDAAELLKLVH